MASEHIDLTSAVQTSVGATAFRLWYLDLRRTHPDRPAGILAIFREIDGAQAFVSGGRSIECRWDGAPAQALLVALNKANLTTLSLEKRVTQQCQTDGKLPAGAISGVPD